MTAVGRFEKSLYDLIRGLRAHKGSEAEYIQSSLKECRSEIKSPDMGQNCIIGARAGFGTDRSWDYRQEDHGASQVDISRNVRIRHVLGLIPCSGSDVFGQVSTETSWVPRCSTELSARYGGLDASDEPAQKGSGHPFITRRSSNPDTGQTRTSFPHLLPISHFPSQLCRT